MKPLPFVKNISSYDLFISLVNNFNEDKAIFDFNENNKGRGIEVVKNIDKKYTNARWKLKFLNSDNFIIGLGHSDNFLFGFSSLDIKIMLFNDFKRVIRYSKLTNKQLADLQSKGYWD